MAEQVVERKKSSGTRPASTFPEFLYFATAFAAIFTSDSRSNLCRSSHMHSPTTLEGVARGVDIVISAIGITKQKDGLSYEDVDYQANLNLLNEALASGIRKFVYVSVLHADQMRDLKIVQAKERFVSQLRSSPIQYAVMRPNGYFSDMRAFLNMARKGRAFLFGGGKLRINPISGRDVAARCLDAIEINDEDVCFGGPVTHTHREIAEEAFHALGKQPVITFLPTALARMLLRCVRTVTPVRTYGPIEFTLTVITRDMVGPACGRDLLGDFFRSEIRGQMPSTRPSQGE